MQLNTKAQCTTFTHEGAPAIPLTPIKELRRAVLACLLWEDQFYESGQDIATRIKGLVIKCDPKDVAALAVEARTQYRIRHASLLLARELCRHPKVSGRLVGDTIFNTVQRADELAEFLSLYWADKKQPLSKQVKYGLQRAFHKFDEYALAKYNRDKNIKLLDVMRLVHPKPVNELQSALWKRLRDGELKTPDTWEVALSAGVNKKETFTRLLKEKKLGYLALLRNLRNMLQAQVDVDLIHDALLSGAKFSKALPFRFIAAARHAVELEKTLDLAMQLSVSMLPKLPGKTIVLVDVSGSMVGTKISQKSELDRLDAAAGLAILVNALAEECVVYTFSSDVIRMPPRQGMALRDAICATYHGMTLLGHAIQMMNQEPYDRLIVMTDEESYDFVPSPKNLGYMVNVASYQNSVGYGPWVRLTGFSEALVQWIQASESLS
jgi:hypothetical protein